MKYTLSSGALFDTVAPLVQGMGLQIVELVGKQRKNAFQVNLVIYRDSGVDLSICTKVYKTVYPKLEVALEIPDIHLEVSSPGVYRNFKDAREFGIFHGMKVKILLDSEVDWHTGIIGECTEESVDIESVGETRPIRFEHVRKAQLVYP
jgi:ribosome maturation factor RimP